MTQLSNVLITDNSAIKINYRWSNNCVFSKADLRAIRVLWLKVGKRSSIFVCLQDCRIGPKNYKLGDWLKKVPWSNQFWHFFLADLFESCPKTKFQYWKVIVKQEQNFLDQLKNKINYWKLIKYLTKRRTAA